ncbi:ATP-dependent protease HslVU (ClpYQ) peptidase subunit [Chromobacterium alkanivorans]|uniref:MFS transporter n=1 Tax=Chromobacterium TaxID=535 RepID=UPI000653EBEC|nr:MULTISPECIES: MFS transporter [Chromobacterium]KMN83966.1 MFS transporter [Chromobacterium sp. LK11]MBN3005756.1 MFS transporter [Chromobacterium alkanivorans]MCS3806516.1 ATP-dependent protease HslVU (ClpYQ) peptidase subunit [Chromobacterium alkanivorans]MCS3820789.1 ATP-dependent protease HslVU (ClpYQ) peptidase subunit [Chromobacterium alkanivorans]MCS3875711.1 ATP-dependent protease HslVU (ClpYQ) peptidase subunit [Chromobacterium alkanivorans]
MTTIVAVRKGDQIAIAADSQTTFGDDQKLLAGYDCFHNKIFQHGDSYLAISGSAAHDLVLQGALKELKKKDLSSRQGIFETFRKLHPKLKDGFYLRPEEDEEDPYESSQMMVVIANRHGIFGVYPMREIYEFSRIWAIGSGRKFAMGAMYAVYDQALSAREIAEIGVRAGCEFDVSSSMPMTVYTVELAADKDKKDTA